MPELSEISTTDVPRCRCGTIPHGDRDIAGAYRCITAGKRTADAGFTHRIDLDEFTRRPDFIFTAQLSCQWAAYAGPGLGEQSCKFDRSTAGEGDIGLFSADRQDRLINYRNPAPVQMSQLIGVRLKHPVKEECGWPSVGKREGIVDSKWRCLQYSNSSAVEFITDVTFQCFG